jgi:5-(carboxyamino)imidazole ribonucleotide mutase
MSSASPQQPLVGVIMGSKSDYATMRAAVEILREFGVPYEARVVSAHRTPELMFEYAGTAASRGLRVIIAGAGGAAHLPGMVAARTTLPVLGVPIAATALQGFDALLSIVQMPKGIPVGTLAIGAPGAANAGLLAVQILASVDPELSAKLTAWRAARRDEVLLQSLEESGPVQESKPLGAGEPLEPSKVLEDSKSFDDTEPEVIR